MIATLGADVIHVESISRFDGMRATGGQTGHGRHVVGAQPALPVLEHQQARPHVRPRRPRPGSRCCATSSPTSDAVLENFSPRVLGNFGLGWDTIRAINPRSVLVRMPAFGLSGPWRDNVGFAQTMEQVTGLAWITGLPDDQPRIQQRPERPERGDARGVRR